jgi:hypothetical protein
MNIHQVKSNAIVSPTQQPNKIAQAINRFWAADGELRACDVPRSVIRESPILVVHGKRILSLLLSGDLPKNLANIAAGLPPGWTCSVVPHSSVIDNTTRTRDTLQLSIDVARATQHPLATEWLSIIGFTITVFAIILTWIFRFIYIY